MPDTDPLDLPGLDTWLARALHAAGRVQLPVLREALEAARAGGPALARSLVGRGVLAEAEARTLVARLRVEAPPGPQPGAPGAGPGARWAPGAVIAGRYRLEARLGQGGMGEVFRATELETGREVALKSLLDGADVELRLRFTREAEAQARVDGHPHVVAVHAAGTDDGRAWLAMDLCPGGDLQARLAAGPLPWRLAAVIGRDLARGLAHVHARGVLHRDLKPANVLFAEDGRPLLVDFGLARLQEDGAASLTATGAFLGTPAYMAPEQANGKAADVRTDVYGLGATLYAALTGRAPCARGSVLATLQAVLEEPPPAPSHAAPDVPPALDAVVLRCLGKDPADRFPDAGALAEALARTLEPARRPSSARSTPALLGLLAVLALAAGGGAVLLVERGRGAAPPAPAVAPPLGEVAAPEAEGGSPPPARAEDLASEAEPDPPPDAALAEAAPPARLEAPAEVDHGWTPTRDEEMRGVEAHEVLLGRAPGVARVVGRRLCADGPTTFYTHGGTVCWDPGRRRALLVTLDSDKAPKVWLLKERGDRWLRLLVDRETAPSPRTLATATLDLARRRLVLYGGKDHAGKTLRDGELWLLPLDGDRPRWEPGPGGPDRPPPRHHHAAAWDGAEVIVVGGFDGRQHFGDQWAWTGAGWRAVDVPLTVEHNPRSLLSLAVDRERVPWTYGGWHPGTGVGYGLWEHRSGRPHGLDAAPSPGPRILARLAWTRYGALLFGGRKKKDREDAGDAWLFTDDRWVEVQRLAGWPDALGSVGFAQVSDAEVLFVGGIRRDGSASRETWHLRLLDP